MSVASMLKFSTFSCPMSKSSSKTSRMAGSILFPVLLSRMSRIRSRILLERGGNCGSVSSTTEAVGFFSFSKSSLMVGISKISSAAASFLGAVGNSPGATGAGAGVTAATNSDFRKCSERSFPHPRTSTSRPVVCEAWIRALSKEGD